MSSFSFIMPTTWFILSVVLVILTPFIFEIITKSLQILLVLNIVIPAVILITDDEIIRMNMLIHGHDTNVELLKLDEKLVDLAVMLAITDDYDNTGFKSMIVKPKIFLRDSRVFLKEKFVIHKIPFIFCVVMVICRKGLLKKLYPLQVI